MKEIWKKYETILGAIVGVVPTFLLKYLEPCATVPSWWLVFTITASFLCIWYLKVGKINALEELQHIKEKCDSKSVDEFHYDIKLQVIDVDWNRKKMKISCNIDTNVIEKNQCLSLYQREDGYPYICGIARIIDVDIHNRIYTANILPINLVDDFRFNGSYMKENLLVSPVLEYDILEALVKLTRENNDG